MSRMDLFLGNLNNTENRSKIIFAKSFSKLMWHQCTDSESPNSKKDTFFKNLHWITMKFQNKTKNLEPEEKGWPWMEQQWGWLLAVRLTAERPWNVLSKKLWAWHFVPTENILQEWKHTYLSSSGENSKRCTLGKRKVISFGKVWDKINWDIHVSIFRIMTLILRAHNCQTSIRKPGMELCDLICRGRIVTISGF